MIKVLRILAQQRQKAQKRATDAHNHPQTKKKPSSHLTTVTAVTATAASEPAANANPKHRYVSWATLCQISGRLYPSSEDFYMHHSFHVAPDNFQSHSVGTRNDDCRVCQHLDKTGNHNGALYMGHYANYPTHCPQWAPMTIEERLKVIKEIGMCIVCLNPSTP